MTEEEIRAEKQRLDELNREMAVRSHDRSHALYVDTRKAAIESATVAMRAMILVNGGAVIALLGFLAALEQGNGEDIQISALVTPLEWFAWGVFYAVVTTAIAYLVNMLDSDLIASNRHTWEHPFIEDGKGTRRLTWSRTILHVIALGLAGASLFSFGKGVVTISAAITQLGL
ncbi:MAG: hypothetical protein ACK5JT_13655 [Hyphomicrobiaceae bacterium]